MIFHQAVADIWNAMLKGAPLPKQWKNTKTVFIPKADGGMRPLSIAAACATATLRRLAPWIEEWVPDEVVGRIPGRSADRIHYKVIEATLEAKERGELLLVMKHDLKKAFDVVDPKMAVHIFRHLGVPPGVCKVITDLYTGQQRWLEDRGKCCDEPIQCLMSLLQGCPFSPLPLAAIMTVWVYNVPRKMDGVKCGIYVDDRFSIIQGNTTGSMVKEAERRAKAVDSALGLIRHPDKNECASNDPDRARTAIRGMEDTAGQPREDIMLLGVRHNLVDHGNSVEVEKGDKITKRLNRIKYVGNSKAERAGLVRSLALPMMTWRGAWNSIPGRQLTRIRGQIEMTVRRRDYTGRRRFLVWTAPLGCDLDPEYVMDMRAINTVRWIIIQNIRKGGQTKVQTGQARWRQILAKWNWIETSEDGSNRRITRKGAPQPDQQLGVVKTGTYARLGQPPSNG